VGEEEAWDLRVRADAALRLAQCAIELVHNLTVRMGGSIDFEDAARGLLNSDAVDGLESEQFRLEKASRELTARLMRDLGSTLE
jgi:hypothetical protein